MVRGRARANDEGGGAALEALGLLEAQQVLLQSSWSMKRPWEYSDRLLVAKESRITVTGQVLLCASSCLHAPTSTSVSHTLSPHLNRLPSTYP